jgi:mannose-6-phosphate isomerase-like protein (cupin superfamily)
VLKTIQHQNHLLGLIISNKFSKPGIHFFTPPEFSQQLAYMQYDAGKKIPPHTHNLVLRQVQYTQEILFVKRGKLRVDFYTKHCEYIESHILEANDIILLAAGGHGFEVLEDVEVIEIKQGPYLGEQDRTRFSSIQADQVKIIS